MAGFITPIQRAADLDVSSAWSSPVNTRTSLWPERWPAIALQECIDEVEAAPPSEQEQVKWNLPCSTCPEATRCLNAKRKEIGSLMYDREILTSPRSGQSSLFPRSLMQPMLVPGLTLVPHYRKPLGSNEVVVQAWDLAWSEKTGGDWLVAMTAVINLDTQRRSLIDVDRWQGLTFKQQTGLITEKHRMYESDLVVIESDAAQAVWAQYMAGETEVPVVKHYASDGKTSLQRGVPSILVHFENRRWEIPFTPGSYHHEHMKVFLDELEAFGWVDGKLQGVGEHDDTVMCFWHLNWGCSRYLAHAGVSESHLGVVQGAR